MGKATEQLNIRVPTELKNRFTQRARREGMAQWQLLEALLKQRGTLPPPDPVEPAVQTPRPDPAPEPVPNGQVDFAEWLSRALRVPKVLADRALAAGRVRVGGVPYTAAWISDETLELGVVYEGTVVNGRPVT